MNNSVVAALIVALWLLVPATSFAQLGDRPDLKPTLKTNSSKDKKEDAADESGIKDSSLRAPGAPISDAQKQQIMEAMRDRKPMTTEQLRANLRLANRDYKILMVGSQTAQNAIAYGMRMRLNVSVKVDSVTDDDDVRFYVGLAPPGSSVPVVVSERVDAKGAGPHIVTLVVPVEEPLVADNGRLQCDVILLSDKTMPGLPGRDIVLKRPLQDKDSSNNRKALNYTVQQPEIAIARVSRQGENADTVKVGELVELTVQARVRNGGTARNGFSYAIGDPDAGRIDATGPKIFHQGDGLTKEVRVAFRVTDDQIVNGELRTTLFLLRDSEPSAPFSQRLHVDSIPANDRYALGYTLATTPKGYVLTHEHPTYGMAFGGNYSFAGADDNYRYGIMDQGYTAECDGCKVLGNCDHGETKGSFGGFALGQDMGDHNSFMGPLKNSNSHLRYSTEWIRDAFSPAEEQYKDSRMRIMVAFAVENEAMCEQLYYVNKGNGGHGGDGYKCSSGDSFPSMKRQLDNIKAWVADKDNRDWMEIAYTAADARRIVDANKLAIVLGVESEYAFGAENRTFDPVDRLNEYYDLGVRTFYLAHKINSRLAGADVYRTAKSAPGKAIRATQAIAGCFYYDDNVGHFPLEGNLGGDLCDNKKRCGANAFKGGKITDACSRKLSDVSEANMIGYILSGAELYNGFALYPKTPGFDGKGGTRIDNNGVERNNLGLSYEGERVVREAMLKGMIVNIDHVSSLARDDMYELATDVFDNYPLNAMHNKPNRMLAFPNRNAGFKKKDWQHEYDLDDKELAYIRDTGGFFGFRLGPTNSQEYPRSGISGSSKNCPNTSTESAKMLAYLLEFDLAVGYSLDFATNTQGVFSRTAEKCDVGGAGGDEIHYYVESDPVSRKRKTEGLAHIGMMKQWHNELEAIGLKEKYVEQLKDDGVEGFLGMWEKSEAASGSGEQVIRIQFVPEVEPH